MVGDGGKASSFCPNCRSDLPAGALFCHNCGADVPAPAKARQRELCSLCLRAFHRQVLTCRDGQLFCPGCAAGQGGPAAAKGRPRQHYLKGSERDSERFDVPRSFVHLCRPARSWFMRLLGRKRRDVCELIDLSVTGMQCLTKAPFEAGEAIGIELGLSTLAEPLALRGTVVWVRYGADGQQRLGLRFEALGRNAQLCLEAIQKHAE